MVTTLYITNNTTNYIVNRPSKEMPYPFFVSYNLTTMADPCGKGTWFECGTLKNYAHWFYHSFSWHTIHKWSKALLHLHFLISQQQSCQWSVWTPLCIWLGKRNNVGISTFKNLTSIFVLSQNLRLSFSEGFRENMSKDDKENKYNLV